MAWWRDGDALRRFVGDLVAGELTRLRPGTLPPDLRDQDPAGIEIGPGGLGADSLELVTLATALSEALHLHRSGIEDYLLRRRTLADWAAICAHGLERFYAELGFRTSGSTGAPKLCTHALAALMRESSDHAGRIGRAGRILAAVPSHHIYGFIFTILLPRDLGAPVVDVRGRLPGSIARDLRPGDLVVGYPEFWAGFARAQPALPSGVVGISSTGPLPGEVARAVTGLGLSRLLEIYGSSETAGIGWRDDPADPYTLMTWWNPVGDQHIRDAADGRTLPLPDRVEWTDPIRFRVAGRHDGAVQVGGINVFPDRVAAVLREHPGVADAAVRTFPAGDGLRLKAFIVPADPAGAAMLRIDLDAWCAERLTPAERPRAWSFGPEVPRNSMGKQADWPLDLEPA